MIPTFPTVPTGDTKLSLTPFAGSPFAFRAVLGILASMMCALGARAQQPTLTFGGQAVGVSNTVAVSVRSSAAGIVSTVSVMTQGVATSEFVDAAGACTTETFTGAGQNCTESITFTPKYPGLRTGAIVLQDSSGNVLATGYISGMGQGPLGVFVPGNFIPVAGIYQQSQLFQDNELALATDLNLPASVAFDGAGNVYIADSGNNRIRKVDATSKLISTIAGDGSAGFAGDGGLATSAELNLPSGVAVDGAGNIYIADRGNNRVREVDAKTLKITTVAGNNLTAPDGGGTYSGDGGPASGSGLNGPWGVSVDIAGNLYIADTGNNRVRRVDAISKNITLVAGNGTAAYSGDGPDATLASLNRPFAVAFDASYNMYIPDSMNNVVRMVTPSGTISTFAGTGTVGYTGDGSAAASATLWSPSGVIVDAAQNVYISDLQNNAIRKVSANSPHVISTIVKDNSGEYYANSALQSITLYWPIGMALDGNGDLYVADYYYMQIHKLQSNVAVLDFTGTPVRDTEVSTPLPQVLENDGNAPLILGAISPDSNSAVSGANPSCTAGSTLAEDTSCIIRAEFAPAMNVVGKPFLATINIAGQAVDAPFVIDLLGDATSIFSTTVVLSASTNQSTFAQPVTFSATVTTGGGTGPLNGYVYFYDNGVGLGQRVKVDPTSGLATLTTTALAVGSHNITATYSGDSNGHLTSPYSNTVTVVVNEVTATVLNSSSNPSLVGAPVTLSAQVSILGAGTVTLTSGTVTFTDTTSNTILGTPSINGSGFATLLPISNLSNGVHAITATYSGEPTSDVQGSTSAVLNQEVQATTSATLISSLPTSNYGNSVTFTATVTTTGTIAPSGPVNFLDGNKSLGQGTLNAISATQAVATYTTSGLVVGNHVITASYPGSPSCLAAPSISIGQVVTSTPTTTKVTGTPNPAVAGKPVALTATVSLVQGSAAVTGTVTFADGTVNLGSAQLVNGTASISPTFGPGTHSIVATYGGDANDNGSSSTLSLPVIQATTAVVVTSSGSPAVVLSPITFTALVAGNGGTPTGSVTFLSDGKSIGSSAIAGTGKATITYSALTVGSHTITASYGGDVDDGTSVSGEYTQVVGSISTVTDLGVSATGGTTPQVILVATVLGTTPGPAPTGTVTFKSGSTVIGEATLDSSGVGSLIPDLSAGNYSVVASYSGDAIHSPSTATAVSVSSTPIGYGVSATPATISVATTQNVTVAINLNSTNGFADTIGLGCGTLPAAVNCHFANNTVSLKAGATQSVQLTIDTNNPLGGGQTAMNQGQGKAGMSLASLMWPLAILFGCIFWRFRRRNAIVLLAVLGLFLTGLVGMTGCGGMSQSSAAPGTYTIQINAVGVNSNITHYQNITLTITK